jgi:mRNA interferase HicA
MKRTDVVRKLNEIAKSKGYDGAVFVRQGGEHEIYRVGNKQIAVPRHREINEITARNILKTADQAEPKGE